MIAIGFDTSNYTTSVAAYDGIRMENCSRLLDVKSGELGLRQSDALFSHVKRLPELSDRLFAHIDSSQIAAIGVSTRPRAVEGSYMPCFLAGESQARVLGKALHVPLCCFSHQQGHLAAALWSAGKMDWMEREFLAWHLSGGTTELLFVQPHTMQAQRIGGTTDISAGQLIDRTGKLLGMDFPAGKALDAAAGECDNKEFFPVRINGAEFSLSGMQNKAEAFYEKTKNAAATARYTLLSVSEAVKKATDNAQKLHPGCPVLFSGGVASNQLLRSIMEPRGAAFASPEYSTDNAAGIAVLTFLQESCYG